ncbi:MAG: HAD family hydrolase [Candidatus Methylomirabilales bacterium]
MRPRSVDLILFDLDGTLVDSLADLTAAVNHTLREYGRFPLDPCLVREYVGDGVRKLMERSLAGEDPASLDRAVAQFRTYYGSHLLDHTRLYPGVAEVLQHFTEKVKAVVTNKPQEFSLKILEGLGIAQHFAMVVGGDSGQEQKPHPQPAQHILTGLGVGAARTAMVGDSPVDIEMAKRAGLFACAVTYGLRSREELQAAGPDLLLDDLRELCRHLL